VTLAPVTTHWQTGEQILLRYLRNKPGDLIVPVTVVHDDHEYIALYIAAGTPLKGQATRDGEKITRAMPFVERERLIGGFADSAWSDNHVLMLHRPGRMSAIWFMWRESDSELFGYYGNIQTRLKRNHLGFDTADYLLDVWIYPDFTWRWKDEDEWELAREHGPIAAALLDEVRREGERIVAEVETRAWPFNASFESWRPDPAWPVPQLPPNWDDGLEYPD